VKTTVFLVRHGVTDWHREKKVLGHRDLPMNADGAAQAETAAAALAPLAIVDVISSPLIRASQSAEIIAKRFGMEVARDPRLTDFRVGKWEGMAYDEIERSPEYQRFLADPMSERIPGGENLADVKRRAVAAVEQALEDSPPGDGIVMVTHAGVIRVLLSHYAGSNPANYHRIRVSPGSVSVLSFADDKELPRILGTNWRSSLSDVI
jgi:broad specificity phosphatase PhoE